MDWQRARHEIADLRTRAFRRLIASALRRDETWKLADYYAPPSQWSAMKSAWKLADYYETARNHD